MLAAEATRDPGVAARATRMALYLKDDPAALRMVDIWAAVEPDNLTAHRHAVDLLLYPKHNVSDCFCESCFFFALRS